MISKEKISGALAGGGFGLTALIGACGGACAAAAVPLGGLLAAAGFGSVAIFFVKLRIPLLIISILFASSYIRNLIGRKQYKYATAVGLGSGFLAAFLALQIFFPLGLLHRGAAPVSSTTLTHFRETFNRDSDKVRVVALLSPGCDVCQKAHRETIVPMFRGIGADHLRGYEIWLPWIFGDSLDLSRVMAASLQDARVTHLWDGNTELTKAFTAPLMAKYDVWDIYLIYPKGARWEGDIPPKPAFFMHQLPEKYGLDDKLYLDSSMFIEVVRKQL